MKGKTMKTHPLAYALTVANDLRSEDANIEALYSKLSDLCNEGAITYDERDLYQNTITEMSAGVAFLRNEIRRDIEQDKKKSVLTRLFK